MYKDKYIKSFREHYPEEPDEVLELAWHFHGVEKAREYVEVLNSCNSYADVANKAIRQMYVSGDIDSITAVSEKFIALLLPFTCMGKQGKPHSVAYHVRKMLENDTVKVERKRKVEVRDESPAISYQEPSLPRTADVTIEIRISTDNTELIREILRLAKSINGAQVKMEERMGESIVRNFSKSVRYLARPAIRSIRREPKLALKCPTKSLPQAIATLGTIFGEKDPEVRFLSESGNKLTLPLSKAQQMARMKGRDSLIGQLRKKKLGFR
jgi:hypothetical protein